VLLRRFCGFNLWCVALICALSTVCLDGANLIEPITLTSKNGVLDILMIAKAAPISTPPASPIGWVFQICARPSDKSNACPAEVGATSNHYGGTRLQVERGDLLKISLVNQLPLALDSEHATEPDQQYLMLNPVNLDTEGLIVSPQAPTDGDPTYGDDVFVLTFNSGNGKPTTSPRLHSTVRYDYTDYSIRIPIDHPSGLFLVSSRRLMAWL
jgi:hypothetical protein